MHVSLWSVLSKDGPVITVRAFEHASSQWHTEHGGAVVTLSQHIPALSLLYGSLCSCLLPCQRLGFCSVAFEVALLLSKLLLQMLGFDIRLLGICCCRCLQHTECQVLV